ncbi:hypothetical protein [Rhodopirellula halodulae]|uniref:hypothetical protein n=1 Tax=Rhodopirellula halodulae TaxID=2894198 RepID=UPI0034D5964C
MFSCIIRFFWHCVWYANSRMRTFVLQLFPQTFFRSIGRNTKIFGWPSFGTCNGNISVGADCLIGRSVFLSAHRDSEIIIGDGCSMNTGCHIVSVYGITIGAGTRIGEFCSIRDQNHDFTEVDKSVSNQGFVGGKIVIERNCWIGRGVFIGPNIKIGQGAIVGANAVVTKSVAPYDIVAGIPAKVIGNRNLSNR